MKTLGVKFSDTQLDRLKEVSTDIGIDVSKLARAALRLGLIQVNNLSVKDVDKAVDLVLVHDARAKQ